MELNLDDPEIQYNPYPPFRRMRDEAPGYDDAGLNFFALTRYIYEIVGAAVLFAFAISR